MTQPPAPPPPPPWPSGPPPQQPPGWPTRPPTPTATPRRRRPSGWWFAVGGVLVAAGIAIGVVLFVLTLSGFLETDATVEADGAPHQVSVGTDGDRMVWGRPGSDPSCSIQDTGTGRTLDTSPVTASYTKSDGSGDWRGLARFDPGAGDLTVTCEPAGGPVQIGPAPAIAGFVGGIVATILVPLVLGGSGLVVLLVTTILFVTGRPRDEPA